MPDVVIVMANFESDAKNYLVALDLAHTFYILDI